MENQFYYTLAQYLKQRDTSNANRLIMQELGKILIKDRENFITLLRYADIPASDTDLDIQLIDKFIENIRTNRQLMIGTAFLINQHNKKMGFNGQEEISDAGVKAVHKVMYNYFDAGRDEYANAGGAWAAPVDSLAKLGSTIVSGQQKKNNIASDALAKQQEAHKAILDTALMGRQNQLAATSEKVKEKAKTKKILIISGVSVLGIALIVGGVLLYKHFKRK